LTFLSFDPLSGVIALLALAVSIYTILYTRRADHKTKLERAKELHSEAEVNLTAVLKHAPEIKATWQGAATLCGALNSSRHALLIGEIEEIETEANNLQKQLADLDKAVCHPSGKNISRLITKLIVAKHAAQNLRLRCSEEQTTARSELSDARSLQSN